MPVFEYKGLDKAGKAVSNIVEAENARIARSRVRKLGVFPTEVREQRQGGNVTSGTGLGAEIDVARYFQFITSRDVSMLTMQLATLVGASVPMGETLTALVDQAEKSKLKIILSQVKEKVHEGATLADALKEHPSVFDDLYIHMVRAGERSGSLSAVLRRLSEFTDSQVKLQGKLSSALAYPILMGIIGTLILAGLFVGVIPKVRSLFDGLGGDAVLPLITRIVFFVGDTLTSLWVLVPILAVAVGVLGFRAWVRTEAGRYRWDYLRLRVPLFGKMNRLVAVSRFCRTLSTLLSSGVPIITALGIVREVVGNVVVAKAIDDATNSIREGQSIAGPLKASGEFPPMVTHMIAIGERTGELERMLGSVSDAYDEQVEQTMNAFTSLLGPLMILLMGGIVFIVALGLLLPMMNISKMIH